MVDVSAPWSVVDESDRTQLEDELRRELRPGHALAGKPVRALARRHDRDDVLFEVDGASFVVVHLTWSEVLDPRWPTVEGYTSLEDWIERRMKPDHDASA